MSLERLFRAVVGELKTRRIPFAVAGGLAADLYRQEPRLTMDVDLVIFVESKALEVAVSIVETIGLKAGIARQADLAGGPLFAIRKRSTPACMVIGRPQGEGASAGVDILLPSIPWVRDAVARAQDNQVDFGFGAVPVLRLEDVVVAKLYALMSAQVRVKDLDDLQSILAVNDALDWAYLAGQVLKFKIAIPKSARPFLPKMIVQIASGRPGRETGRA